MLMLFNYVSITPYNIELKCCRVMSGMDDKGSRYGSIDEMWEAELHNQNVPNSKVIEPVGSVQKWYHNANSYWAKSQPTYNGVLGGYGHLSSLDIKFSLGFLLSLVKKRPLFKRQVVLDCGAGIGRISKELLCQVFKTVDVVDQCGELIEKAKDTLKDKNVRQFMVRGLQELEFNEKYDCIWVQWVFSHLNDQDAVKFLVRAKNALKEGGVIVLKENHCNTGFVVDKQDFSVTRSTPLFKKLFTQAQLEIVAEQTQQNWPKDLFNVRVYALA